MSKRKGPDDWIERAASGPSWVRGEIPWTLEGFREALANEVAVYQDHTRQSAPPRDNRPARPQDHEPLRAYSVGKFAQERYGDQLESLAHGYRYVWAMRFLGEEHERLLADGLLLGRDETLYYSNGLLHALAVLPFSVRRVNPDGSEDDVYAYIDVVATARRYNARGPS